MQYKDLEDLKKQTSFFLDDRIRSEIYIGESGWFRCSSLFTFKEVKLGLLYNFYETAYVSIESEQYTGNIIGVKQVCLITVKGEFFVFDSWEEFKNYILAKHKTN